MPLHSLSNFHWHLIDDLDSETFERRHFLWTICQQTYPPQIQVGQNLGADSDLALHHAFVVVERRQCAAAMESEGAAVSDFFDRKSLVTSGANR